MIKIRERDFEVMKSLVSRVDTPEMREVYRARNFPRADLIQDLDKRYRWDCFWAAMRQSPKLRAHIHSGDYNDAHIDTALRKIVAPLDKADR